ncbi:MAG: DoxX family protein [Polyangiales bacterium]
MDGWLKTRAWIDGHRDVFLDLLRIYLGVALFIKGCVFIRDSGGLVDVVGSAHVPFAAALVAHYVTIAHLAGGAMLAAGLLTRIAAIVQVPALAGAILFVHLKEGLFTKAGTLELTMLVLFLLLLFSVVGGGPLSADARLRESGPDAAPNGDGKHARA